MKSKVRVDHVFAVPEVVAVFVSSPPFVSVSFIVTPTLASAKAFTFAVTTMCPVEIIVFASVRSSKVIPAFRSEDSGL